MTDTTVEAVQPAAVVVPPEPARVELALFKCHHEVRAGKISRIERAEGGYDLFCSIVTESDAKVHVLSAWHEKHQPQVGGYLVVYADGIRVFRPADQFEADYAKTSAAHVEAPRSPHGGAVRAQDDIDRIRAEADQRAKAKSHK